MRPNRKENREYHFTLDGWTEKWYLDHLKRLVNVDPQAKYNVIIKSEVGILPYKYAKKLSAVSKREVTHWLDYESSSHEHTRRFQTALDSLKEANGINGKQINYRMGYSNLTFELWMVLHKINCNGFVNDRAHYLRYINSAFDEKFLELRTYKEERNFKRVLNKVTLDDVRRALDRAKTIMQRNADAGHRPIQYKGFSYYFNNPSLSIHESVEKILIESGVSKSLS